LATRLQSALVENGYQVDTAPDAGEARNRVHENAYEIIILDYHLPDDSGTRLLEKFLISAPMSAIIMMTGDPGPELAVTWMKKGAAAYLRKPFNPDYLV